MLTRKSFRLEGISGVHLVQPPTVWDQHQVLSRLLVAAALGTCIPIMSSLSYLTAQWRAGFHLFSECQKGADGFPLKTSLPQARQAQFSQSLLEVMWFSSWPSPRPSDVFDPVSQQYFSAGLVVDRYSSQGTDKCWVKEKNHSPLCARLLLVQPSLLLPFIAASEHWGLVLSSAHLNPKAPVIQPVSL